MTHWIAAASLVILISDPVRADQGISPNAPRVAAPSTFITAVGPAQSIVLRDMAIRETLNRTGALGPQSAQRSSSGWRQRHPVLFPVLVGAGIGAAAGAILGAAAWSENQKGFHRDDAAILYSSFFGLTGAGVGLTVGLVRQ